MIAWLVYLYAALGLLFGVSFVAWGIEKVDPAARGAGIGFRILILPGVAALWPLMLVRWLRGEQG
jgi:hypothetical protein